MPGALAHSPAQVLARCLVELALGTDPLAEGLWPIGAAAEPSTPDNCVTVYDTSGFDHGRDHVTGQRQEHHGVQLRVRAATHKIGWAKARALAVALDEAVYQETPTIDNIRYLIHAVTRTSDVLTLGKEPASQRRLFTINAKLTLRTDAP